MSLIFLFARPDSFEWVKLVHDSFSRSLRDIHKLFDCLRSILSHRCMEKIDGTARSLIENFSNLLTSLGFIYFLVNSLCPQL